jgi:hypothetical protein
MLVPRAVGQTQRGFAALAGKGARPSRVDLGPLRLRQVVEAGGHVGILWAEAGCWLPVLLPSSHRSALSLTNAIN